MLLHRSDLSMQHVLNFVYFDRILTELSCGGNAFEASRKRVRKVDGCSRERAQYSEPTTTTVRNLKRKKWNEMDQLPRTEMQTNNLKWSVRGKINADAKKGNVEKSSKFTVFAANFAGSIRGNPLAEIQPRGRKEKLTRPSRPLDVCNSQTRVMHLETRLVYQFLRSAPIEIRHESWNQQDSSNPGIDPQTSWTASVRDGLDLLPWNWNLSMNLDDQTYCTVKNSCDKSFQ